MPPLLMDNYFFPVVAIQANLDLKPGEDGIANVSHRINVNTAIRQNNDNDRNFQLTAEIDITHDPESDFSYQGKLVVVGIFTVSEEYPVEDRTNLVGITGTSMLYGAAREFLLGITSRGPYPAVYLPTMSFRNVPSIPEPEQPVSTD